MSQFSVLFATTPPSVSKFAAPQNGPVQTPSPSPTVTPSLLQTGDQASIRKAGSPVLPLISLAAEAVGGTLVGSQALSALEPSRYYFGHNLPHMPSTAASFAVGGLSAVAGGLTAGLLFKPNESLFSVVSATMAGAASGAVVGAVAGALTKGANGAFVGALTGTFTGAMGSMATNTALSMADRLANRP